MYTRLSFAVAVLCVGSALSLPAADTKEADRVADLIAKLGSDTFEDREQATSALDKIGLPALEELRKATESTDPEIKKRALELVQRIEKRLETDKVLSATRVHLQLKDVTVPDAVAELSRQSGYAIELPEKDKLAARRVTLDTGSVSFWMALDKLCNEAGITEKPEATTEKDKEATKEEVIRRQMIRRFPAQQAAEPMKIVLVDGKPESKPTCYAGAVRIRVLPGAQRSGNDSVVSFQICAEPKVQWSGAPTLTIEKAVDDRGQELMVQNEQAVDLNMAQNIMIINGRFMDQSGMGASSFLVVPIRFKNAADRKLAEIKGSVSGPVQTPTQPLITVDNITKQIGQTVKGAKGGSITINEAAADAATGNFKVKLTLDPPVDPNAAANGNAVFGGGGRVQIAIAANGQAVVMPAGGAQGNLELLDPNGKKIVQAGGNQRLNALPNGGLAIEHDLVFKPAKDQQPTKLVYLGSQTSTVTVPFTLEGGK